MNNSYTQTEKRIRRSVLLFSLLSLSAVVLLSILLFLRETYLNFEAEKERIRHEQIEQRKAVLKSRVDNAIQIIQNHRQRAEERLKRNIQERVDHAVAVAEAIYAQNKGRLSDTQIQAEIIAALRPLRWREGNSYIWITDARHRAILAPTAPQMEGKSLAFIVDPEGNSVVERQTRTAKTQGAGFNHDHYRKPSDSSDKTYAQISYVRDFKRWGWVFGSAEFVDVFEEELQQEILQTVSDLRFGGNYIFIDTYEGYAILMNGELLLPPRYSWELENRQGVKILQEQLKAALASPEGGFLSYNWFENALQKEMSHLSFVRVIPEWRWKIGTGSYIDDIEEAIAAKEALLWKRTWLNIAVLGGALLAVLMFAVFVALGINRRIAGLFGVMNDQLGAYHGQLENINSDLQKQVEEETERRLVQEELLVQASKMADMGNMLALIAHQWKQPLSALWLAIQEFGEKEITPAESKKLIEECQQHINYMSETVEEFRNYFRPESQRRSFSLKETVISAATLLKSRFLGGQIRLSLPVEDHQIVGFRNDLRQVLISLMSNACDAVEERINKERVMDGALTFSFCQQGSQLLITLCDSGGGIPESKLEEVFQPYFSTKGEKGTGIGLYMSRRIIEERFSGTLTASNGDDGACFTLEIPLKND